MNELTVAPAQAIGEARNVADACRAIVLKTTHNIGGKQYVCVEGWMAIAVAHGCTLSAGQVHGDREHGFTSIGEVRRIADGAILATAEGFVGPDERMWRGRPEYASRAMAQTRAMSRAARSAFAHVVVLMDAGLGTTPAEEMMGIQEEIQPIVVTASEPSGMTPAQEMRVDLLDRLFKCEAWFEKQGITLDKLEEFVSAPRAEWGENHLHTLRDVMQRAKDAAGKDSRKLSWLLARAICPDAAELMAEAEG